jgi:UDP-GlcNAc3NAcA epimerase
MVISIVGARPQFIKAAVVSKALAQRGIPEIIIHTGQHYDDSMSQIFWDEMDIPASTVNLGIGSGNHAVQTARMMEKIDAFLNKLTERPKAVLVYGDTNSTLASALVAAKLNLPIIHVESGLRSFNREMPEEVNRIVTDHLSSILFCSSEESGVLLNKEGINKQVYNVGDVMMDAIRIFKEKAKKNALIEDLIDAKPRGFNLITIHRPSNTDNENNLLNIVDSIREINETFIWPLHPRISLKVNALKLPANLIIKEPFSYLQMLTMLGNCNKVFTDSGGLQKEAYWMKKPCITLREETEWIETMHDNWNILTGAVKKKIIAASATNIEMDTWKPLYGDGFAGAKIAEIIHDAFY